MRLLFTDRILQKAFLRIKGDLELCGSDDAVVVNRKDLRLFTRWAENGHRWGPPGMFRWQFWAPDGIGNIYAAAGYPSVFDVTLGRQAKTFIEPTVATLEWMSQNPQKCVDICRKVRMKITDYRPYSAVPQELEWVLAKFVENSRKHLRYVVIEEPPPV